MGLLDALSSDDARLGMGLLAAGGPSTVPMNIGQRVQMAMQGLDADKQNKLKMQLLQSQVDENKSQNQLRQAQLQQQAKRDAFFMGDDGVAAPQATSQAAPGAAPGGGSTTGGGEALKQATGVPANTPPPAQGKFAEWSQKFNIPVESLVADYFTNGGKGIAEMMFKRGTPDMQVTNGFAYDKNKLPGGFMPQVNTSADGKTSVILPNGNGGVNVGVPNGALGAFNAYTDAGNRSAAAYKEGTPTIGSDGRKRIGSVLSNVDPQAPSGGDGYRNALQNLPPAQPGMSSSFQGPPEKVLPLIASMKDPQERANAYDAYSRQMTGPNAGASAGGNVVELSPQEQTQNTVDKEYQTGVVKDQVEQRKNIVSAGFQAPGRIAKLQQIDKLLGDFEGGKLSQTGVDFASSMNSLGIKVDKNLPNKEAAMAMSREIALSLRNPAGGAGMPGAMSDADRNFLSSMTPDIGQTADGRRQIIRAGVAVETRNQQVAEFARKYEAKYGKLDNGFYSQLSNWSSANPLFGK